MLEDFYLPMRLAVWNRARSVWETGQMQFLCEHSVPFLATWPTSGMTRSGQAFELPTPELHTGGSASSLLRTPVAAEGSGGAKSPATSHQVMLRDQVTEMLPTPRTSDTNGAGEHGTGGPDLRTVVSLLPTPQVADVTGGHKTRSGARSNEMLLPGVVLTLGATTDPRFDGGNTYSEDRPRPRLNLTDEITATVSLPVSLSG